jgi:hypothetical protein
MRETSTQPATGSLTAILWCPLLTIDLTSVDSGTT